MASLSNDSLRQSNGTYHKACLIAAGERYYTYSYTDLPSNVVGINTGRTPFTIKSTSQDGKISEFLFTISGDVIKITGDHSMTIDKTNKTITIDAGSGAWGCAILEGHAKIMQYFTTR